MGFGSDRSVKLTVAASMDGFVDEMARGARAGMQFESSLRASTKRAAVALHSMKDEAREVAVPLLAIGTVAAAGVAYAIKSYADFDERMASVKSLSHANVEQQRELKDAALETGTAIGYSATQAADAEIELVKAGVKVADITGGALAGSLNLAAAGQIDVADATAIAASTLTQFGLKGKDTTHIADLLAAGADKALGGVSDLGEGLKYIGPVAASSNVSLEQTVGTMALLAQNGILGQQAGTGLRGILLSLTAPSELAAKTMKQYGINVYDAQGKFVGFNGVAEQLSTQLGTLDDSQRDAALGTIFGNEQITAATVLMKGGAKEVDRWTAAVDEQGFAAEQAAGKMDNLNGDLKKLQAAFQTAGIVTGEAADGPLRTAVQVVTDLIGAYNEAPDAVQGFALGSGVLVAAVTLSSGALLLAVPKAVEFGKALTALSTANIPGVSRAATVALRSTSALGRGLGALGGIMTGPWGAAVVVAAAAATVFVQKQIEASERTAQFKSTLDETTGAVTKATESMVASNLATKGTFFGIEVGPSALEQAKQAGLSLETVTKAAEGNADAYRELKRQQEELDDARGVGNVKANNAAKAADAVVRKVDEQRTALGSAKDQQKLLNEAQEDSESTTETASRGLDGVTLSAEDAAKAIQDTANALKNLTSPTLDARDAKRQFQAAVDAVTDTLEGQKEAYKTANGSLDGFNASLEIGTKEGRDNQAALDGIAQAAENAAGSIFTQTGSQQQATAAMQQGRDELIAALGQYGITGQAAQDYADKIIGTPTDWATQFEAKTDGASGKVSAYQQKLDALPKDKQTEVKAATDVAAVAIQGVLNKLNLIPNQKTITITTNHVDVATRSNTNGIFKANGGRIVGPGTGTSDDVPLWGSNGEWVIRESSSSMYGPRIMTMINEGLINPKALHALAEGRQQLADAVSVAGGAAATRSAITHAAAAPYRTGGQITRASYAPPSSAPIIVQATAGGGNDVFAPVLQSTGNFRSDIDTVMFRYRTQVRGGRRR